jgi:ATP-dependent RNA helicase RhlE
LKPWLFIDFINISTSILRLQNIIPFLHLFPSLSIISRNKFRFSLNDRSLRLGLNEITPCVIVSEIVLSEGNKCKNGIIFCNRKIDVDILMKSMKSHGFNVGAIHGDLEQSTRMEVLNGFKDESIGFLIASDVAARGLDIPNVSHVFNFDVPIHSEDYVHRIGRTGRAGRPGSAIMISTPTDSKSLSAIERLIKMQVPEITLCLTDN